MEMTILVHRKNKKGITPVIAVVMLLLVTVGVVGVSSVWFSGILFASTKKAISIPAGGAYCSGGDIKVYVLNNGDTTIASSDIIVAQVDGVDVKGTPFFGDISSGLVGWWKFDEGTGTTASDSSGYGNTGTLTNMDPLSDWVTSRFGKALDFDGDNDYVDAGTSGSLNGMGKFTIMAWVIQNTNKWAYIMGKDYYTLTGSFDLGWHTTCNNGNGGWWISWNQLSSCFGDTLTNQWVHVAVAYDSDTDVFAMYQNGVPVKTAGATNFMINSPLAWHIGRSSNDVRYWNGRIDEARIYNKATGDVSIPPSKTNVVINYPALQGRHTVRVGTSSGVVETGVTCA